MASYASIISKLKKDWDCPDMMDPTKKERKKIPFSSPLCNYATYGGIPRNAITEFCGRPGGGKSSSAIDLSVNAYKVFKDEFEEDVASLRQKISEGHKEYAGQLEDLIARGPKKVLYVDLEHTFDFKWAKKMGGTPDNIDTMQPPDVPAEEILQSILEIIESGEVGFIILDSIPSLVPKTELEKKIGEKTVAALAGLMTVFLRKVIPILVRYECTLLLVNQERPNMENPYAINTPGGEAIKFYSSLRIYFKLGTPVDIAGNDLPQSAENPAGYNVSLKLLKQKSAPFDRKIASYYLMTQTGLRPDFDYVKLAINNYGVIRKSGGWFTMTNPETGEILEDEAGKPLKVNGQVKVYAFLQEHQEYYATLKKYIEEQINSSDDEEVVDEH